MRNKIMDLVLRVIGSRDRHQEEQHYQSIFSREIYELEQMIVYVDEAISCLLGDMDQKLVGRTNVVPAGCFKDYNTGKFKEEGLSHIYGARMRHSHNLLCLMRNDLMMRLEEAKHNLRGYSALVGPV